VKMMVLTGPGTGKAKRRIKRLKEKKE